MKSINRTFRLDEELLKTVHELAHQKNVSLNEFVADALREAAADALMEGIEMEEVPSTFMLRLMELVSTESVAELGTWSAVNSSPKFVWADFQQLSPDTVKAEYLPASWNIAISSRLSNIEHPGVPFRQEVELPQFLAHPNENNAKISGSCMYPALPQVGMK